MAKTRHFAGASSRSFAHLLGIGPKAGKRVEDDKDKDPKDPKDPEAARVEQEPDPVDNGKSECAVCEGTGTDEDGDKCEACDGTGEVGQGDDPVEPEKKPEGKKAEDEDDDVKGRKAERTRWTRVLQHPAAGGTNIAAACSMLANTPMKASAIISALDGFEAPSAATRAPKSELYRMNGDSRPPNPGSAASRAEPQSFADQVKAAVALVRPK